MGPLNHILLRAVSMFTGPAYGVLKRVDCLGRCQMMIKWPTFAYTRTHGHICVPVRTQVMTGHVPLTTWCSQSCLPVSRTKYGLLGLGSLLQSSIIHEITYFVNFSLSFFSLLAWCWNQCRPTHAPTHVHAHICTDTHMHARTRTLGRMKPSSWENKGDKKKWRRKQVDGSVEPLHWTD